MIWLLLGCLGAAAIADLDADGFSADVDCDDLDAAVNPDAAEVCNSVDDDCDGDIDGAATDASAWFADFDADSFGDAGETVVGCEVPLDYVADATDCDDTTPLLNPGATENCDNEIDENCDGDTACI